jgi:hypothetical protein
MKKHLEKHPSEQEWMEYLYEEMAAPERSALEAHLKGCPPCHEKRESFRGTQQSLNEWRVELPAKHQFAGSWQPAWKWAAAAVLLVSTAFATGRISRPALDVEALQARISKPIEERAHQEALAASQRALAEAQEKLRAQFAAKLQEATDKALAEAAANTKKQLQELTVTLAALREQDQIKWTMALEEFESERMEEYLKFRADLERVALFSQSVAQLASYSPQGEGEPQIDQAEPEK